MMMMNWVGVPVYPQVVREERQRERLILRQHGSGVGILQLRGSMSLRLQGV